MNLQKQLSLLLKDAVIAYTKTKNTSDFFKKRLDINPVSSIHWSTEIKKMLEEKIKEIERMSMPELQQQFKKYFGWDCKARNKKFLRSRLIYRLQELTFGGLSSTTKFLLYQMAIPIPPIHLTKGSVLEKTYKGKLYRITVGQDHFTMDGKVYKSLSAIAYAITGQRLSGNRFFKIDERKS